MKNTLITERVHGFDLRLETRPGVFSQHEIDTGTRMLIDAMHVSPTARVLDLGCGYGAIGIVAAKLAVRGSVVLIDADIRATRLAQRNLELNGVTNAEVILGDGVHDLPPKSRFDVIASNPPTHSGREVLDDFVDGAYKLLKPRGTLYLVVNRLLSLRREVERVFGAAQVVEQSKGFVVIKAVKTPRQRDEFDV
ncbi:MAG TPA: methyltransferase [Dehalococcoidia bacterium]|nr:methyltransferase [Dehalococcoidia bacterium]